MDPVKRKALVEGLIEKFKQEGMIDDPDMCRLCHPMKTPEGGAPQLPPVFPFGITYKRLYERVLELDSVQEVEDKYGSR